ncbi:hypothetical protein ACFRNJ_18390 [Streptomyces sp. NPDC056721]|uniref:hypothetical protein n=1 Tax=Streptomyces sp. NPDC056721 TaxID=3345923 RepID=UPI003690FC7B
MAAVGQRAGQDAVALGEVGDPVLRGVGVDQGVPVGDPVGYFTAVVGAVRGVVGQALAPPKFGVDLVGDGVGAGQGGARKVPALGRGGASGRQVSADRGW